MTKSFQVARGDQALIVLAGVVVAGFGIGLLYWAQTVLMPVALALFLTFLLTPVVTQLQHWKLGRIPAVVVTTALAAVVLLAVGWLAVSQMSALLADLPGYSGHIKTKIDSIRSIAGGSSAWDGIEKMGRDLNLSWPQPPPQPSPGDTADPENPRLSVMVEQPEATWTRWVAPLFRPTLETLGQCGLTAVLVIFMLLKREDLRNRFIRLIGHGQITTTTKAVDDASRRIGRFLLMQLLINFWYGVVLAVGLSVVGVKYAMLWGLLGGLFRYIPYVGAPATALFPITLSLAQFDAWWPALVVVALVVGLEVIISNFVEPRLYGQSIGVSEVALLIAAAFWAFLWGPVGLILSCPLTVCLVVLGKYVPHLEFLAVLLGDQQPLSDSATYYQRLTAKDHDEATQIVLTTVEKSGGDETYDTLLLPALYYAARDRERGVLEEADECFIHRATREILEDLGEKQAAPDEDQKAGEPAKAIASPAKKGGVLGVPARDDADELALAMLGQLLDSDKWELQTVPFDGLTAEVVELIEKEQPAIICIASLPPGGLAHTRYLCKRLRSRFPRLHIVVGRWGSQEGGEDDRQPIVSAGADHVETTLLGMRSHLNGWLPALLAGDSANGVSHAPRSESGHDSLHKTPLKDPQPALAGR